MSVSGQGDGSIGRLADYLESLRASSEPMRLRERVQRAAMASEAERLIARMESLEEGELDGLELVEAWDIVEFARDSEPVCEAACVIRHDVLSRLDPAGVSRGLEALRGWVTTPASGLDGSLLFVSDSELGLTKDSAALELAIEARDAGWRVLAAPAAGEDAELLRVELRTSAGDAVSLVATESPSASTGVGASVRLGSEDPAAGPSGLHEGGQAADGRAVELPAPADAGGTGLARVAETRAEPLSVTDLFGERIMLRDIEPRSTSLDGIEGFREELGWDEIYVPRKNEPEYARALLRIMSGGGAPPEQILYVGDTLLNDGGAIRGLQAAGPSGNVWGFLCGAIAAKPRRDFAMGRIYFGAEWGSLGSFVAYAKRDGLEFTDSTWVLFDLDQTVYAAKGRDDEPLIRARWDAIRAYLESVVPEYRFDAERAEELYREFDRDEYHPVTRDNLDYVVLLVLAVASGLADASEIRDFANSSRPSIAALAEELRHRASMRVDHEQIADVLEAIKAVYFNTLAGDQTPCKDFRRYECLAMAARMRGDAGKDDDGRIFLNREVVDLIESLRDTSAKLFAVSDRPLEAAVADQDDTTTDLMTVPMAVRGNSLG